MALPHHPDSAISNKRLIQYALIRIFETADPAAADSIVAEHYVDHEAPPGFPQGRAGVIAVAQWLRGALTGLRFDVQDMTADGDLVTAFVYLRGRHDGPLFGVQPTGRELAWKQMHLWRIESGQVTDHWACRDDVGLMRQLGADHLPAA